MGRIFFGKKFGRPPVCFSHELTPSPSLRWGEGGKGGWGEIWTRTEEKRRMGEGEMGGD